MSHPRINLRRRNHQRLLNLSLLIRLTIRLHGPTFAVRVLFLRLLMMIHTILLSVHFSFILHLSIYLCDSIRYFQISSSHINSSTVDHSNLSLSDEFLSYNLIKISNETKSSTRLRNWVSNDLAFFYLAKLRKMISEIFVS